MAGEVTTERLRALLEAFNEHDLDLIMSFFAENCVLEMPRGREPWGTRYIGKEAVREGLATRFAGLPDVQYDEDEHWVFGEHGVSKWRLRGTTREGRRVEVRGCDLLDFRDGQCTKKDAYWKIVEV